jgi:WD40 repeat protein
MNDPLVLDAHGKHAQCVLFSKKHKLLASSGMDAKVHLWSVPGFERTASIEGHANSVNTLSFTPKEDLLATGSSDHTVRIWSFPDGKLLHTLDKQGSARFSPDGKILATIGSGGRVSLWDTSDFATPMKLPKMDKRIFTLAFSPDGTWLVVGGTGKIHRYNLLEHSLKASLVGHQLAVPKVAFTPDGGLLLATGAEGMMSIWNVSTWTEVYRVELPSKGVLQTALSPDGEKVYVSMDYLIVGYSLHNGKQILEIPLTIKGVYGLALSPDGSLLANAGADGNVRIWEINS